MNTADWVLGIISIIFTVGAALVSLYFSRKNLDSSASNIEFELHKVQSEEVDRKVSTVEKVVEEKLTGGITDAQLSSIVDEITLRLKSVNTSAVSSSTVEDLVRNYHVQALTQSKIQFSISAAAALAGFAWILVMGMQIDTNNLVTVWKVLPGTVVDAVAALFFRQASDIRQRATDLYDRLRKDNQVTQSMALVSSIEDASLRSAVKAQLALYMAGLKPNPIDLSTFLSARGTQKPPQ